MHLRMALQNIKHVVQPLICSYIQWALEIKGLMVTVCIMDHVIFFCSPAPIGLPTSGFPWLWYIGTQLLDHIEKGKGGRVSGYPLFNTVGSEQYGCQCADDIFKCIFLTENVNIFLQISLKFVFRGSIDKSALVQVMAWCPCGTKPLPEPMLIKFICFAKPQWVKVDPNCTPICHDMRSWKTYTDESERLLFVMQNQC